MLDVIHIILNAKIILFFKQTKHSSFFSLFINHIFCLLLLWSFYCTQKKDMSNFEENLFKIH